MSHRTIAFDLDGVLARPAAFFVNLAAISLSSSKNRAWEPPSPGLGDALRAIFARSPIKDEGAIRPEAGARGLGKMVETVRYAFRQPTPDAREILEAVRPRARLVLLTNRNSANRERLQKWLQAKQLADYFAEVHLNDTGERGADFKLRRLLELAIAEYVEDNPDICEHLARHGLKVYFRKWGLVRTPAHPSISSFRTAVELLEAVAGYDPNPDAKHTGIVNSI
jgi:phosphoglycolate phosphatase-like HAD superfamily hydrolase